MLKLKLEEVIADEIFEVLQELINRAKENKEPIIISYIAPLLVKYGQALIEAKPKQKRSSPLLGKKYLRQFK